MAKWSPVPLLAESETYLSVAFALYFLGVSFRHSEEEKLSEDEDFVDPVGFWRRMRILQGILFTLVFAGLVASAFDWLENITYLTQDAAGLAYVAMLPMVVQCCRPNAGGLSRWHAIYCTFSVSFVMLIGELFQLAFGAPMIPMDYAHIANYSLIFIVSGSLQGQPSRVALRGGAIDLTFADDDNQMKEEELPESLPVATTSPSDMTPIGQLAFAHVVQLLRATKRHGFLRPIDVPVMGRNIQAQTLAVSAAYYLQKYVPSVADEMAHDEYRDRPEDVPTETRLEEPEGPLEPPLISLWSRETRGLLYVLFRANMDLFGMMFALTTVSVGCYYGPSFFANRLFGVLEEDRSEGATALREAFPWILGLFVLVIFSSTVQSQLWAILESHLTVRITTQLSTMLYAKTLNRSDASRISDEGPSSASQVVTLFLVDLKRVTTMLFDLFMLINVPLELLVGGYFAYRILGVSALLGLASTLVLVPMIAWASDRFSKANVELMDTRDRRMGLLSECFLGIRMVKSQVWERYFQSRIEIPRDQELKFQRKSFILDATLNTLLELNPLLVTVVAFLHYTVILNHSLTPESAFTSLAVFSELRWTLTMLPQSLTNIMQALVSLRRICTFLISGEVVKSPWAEEVDEASGDAPQPLVPVGFTKATIAWEGTGKRFLLRDLSIDFVPGGRNLICGKVGSGKSLLLHALLHEAHIRAGKVNCPRSPRDGVPYGQPSREHALEALDTPRWIRADSVAYAPQMPYLMDATIRDNVLFGLPLGNGQRYQAVLEACSLGSDLAQLDHGDMTEVGENGTELSGGQKARVALARAVYSRAQVVLLDDVLSAVDAHTAMALSERLMCGDLLKDRTLILVSHNVQLIGAHMDKVVYLDNGRVVMDDTGEAFLRSEYYNGLIDTVERHSEEEAPPAVTLHSAAPKRAYEHRERGGIAWKVWEAYVEAGRGWALCVVTVVLFSLASLSDLVNNTWLREWSAASDTTAHSSTWWLVRYTALVFVGLLFGVLRWVGVYTMSLSASRTMFNKMLWRTLRAPLRLHDTMTRGRLMNRFGQDMEVLDTKFARAVADVVICVTKLLTTCIALYMVNGWHFVVALLVLAPIYVQLSNSYIATARDLQRLTSTSRSLVVNSFNNAVHGVVVLRAFGAQECFTSDMYAVLDNNNRYVWWTNQASRWISQVFNFISSFLVLGSCLLIVSQKNLDTAQADFSITFLIDLNFVILFLMRVYTVLQSSGVSVERIFEYATTIEQEAPEFSLQPPSRDWPSHGHIRVEKLSIRYAEDLPDVLHEVSFDVPAGTRLAVVGPTGSGKSTLANAFLRFVEAHHGRILLDDVDISKIGLTDLRSRLQIIPQDPVILSGTLRTSLDILNEYSDEALLNSLRTVQLIQDESSPFADLEMTITEGGTNLSQGQRQLLCMARAILRHARVVLLDEASSSIDYDTDTKITELVQDSFVDSSVITVAHRLRSVIGYGKVLYLDAGRVAEIGEPYTLLQDTSSRFFQLCQCAGASELSFLQEAAKKAHDARTQKM